MYKIYNTYYPLKDFTISCDNKLKIEIKNDNLENYKINDKILNHIEEKNVGHKRSWPKKWSEGSLP